MHIALRWTMARRPPSSRGRHGASLPVPRHTTISQYATQQVYVVKTRVSFFLFIPITQLVNDVLSSHCTENTSSPLPPPWTQQPILHQWPTCCDTRPKGYMQAMFCCHSGVKQCLKEVQIVPPWNLLCVDKIAFGHVVMSSGQFTISQPHQRW